MPDSMFGPYRLVAQVGEGGMGKVYLGVRADQQFEQKVAIKFATGALQDQELAFRFRLERQTLAKLDHPNIVRLVDGGTTSDGVPYLIMDHVDGLRLDQYVAEHNLSIRQRIELFRKTCSAVQYAHQHLIVHRDIKPANILVTPDGEPKLLDFGIAKLLDSYASEQALTASGVVPMTLRYGSPEQVQGHPVTVATDLFALAVVLYELLTGRSPHYQEGVGMETIMHRILAVDPAVPSSVAPQARELKGDLDAIVMKALRKEPPARYASVAEFSEDLRRFLEGRPVQARHGNWVYRVRKFAGRHKVAAAAATVGLTALLVAFGITLWQWRIARIERIRADARFQDVHELARSFVIDFEEAIEHVPGSAEPRILLLRKTSEYLERLSRDAGQNEGVILDIGEAYIRLGGLQASEFQSSTGDLKAAEVDYRKAVEIESRLFWQKSQQARDITARARLQLSDVLSQMGRIQESVTESHRAADIWAEIGARDPKDIRALRDAGIAYLYLGGVTGSPDQLNLGDRRTAIEFAHSGVTRWEKFVAAGGGGDYAKQYDVPIARLLLAYLLSTDGAQSQARSLVTAEEVAFRDVVRSQHPSDETVAELDMDIARVLQRLEQHAAAEPYLADAIQKRRAALEAGRTEPGAQFELADALYHDGISQTALRHTKQAHTDFENAASLLEALAKHDPNNLLWRNALANALVQAGEDTRALRIVQELATRHETTPSEVLRYARLLADHEPARAIAEAQRAADLAHHADWEIEDALAELSAGAGHWQDAVEAEGRARGLLQVYKPGPSDGLYQKVRERFDRYAARVGK
jgi:tetratricopeptide (TPR) repeat protein